MKGSQENDVWIKRAYQQRYRIIKEIKQNSGIENAINWIKSWVEGFNSRFKGA